MAVANTAVIKIGRLLEIRADAGYRTVSEVDQLFDLVESAVAELPPGQRHVTVVDWRRCPVMSPEGAASVARRIVTTNARTERSAALAVTDAPVAVLQFLRVIREAGLADRKLFFAKDQLVPWLDEVLTPPERVRLREFLNGG